MELVESMTCKCRPGFTYKNLSAHKKTKTHLAWLQAQDNRADKARAKDFENEVERLRRRLDHKEEVEKELIARIKTLEKQLKYYDGVYL
jgi:CII-binding regulator of phage lambda lysogenization HflD